MINSKNPECTGCAACMNACPKQCITMKENEEGFLYPFAEETQCIHCGICLESCPLPEAHKQDDVLPLPTVYAIHNRDERIRRQSSSGGVFSALADFIIKEGGVVYGAKFDDAWNVIHGRADTEEAITPLRTSKYVQSEIGMTFRDVKNQLRLGKQVLFSGTECQVAGLKRYLKDTDCSLLFCQGLVCHGVPSAKVWRKYLDYQEKRSKSRVASVSFRDKRMGWEDFSMRIDFENGKIYSRLHQLDLYFQAFLSDICLRPCCYACKFRGIYRHSDITLADFWNVDRFLPDKRENKGESLVLIHSEKAETLMKKLNGTFDMVPIKLDTALRAAKMLEASADYNEQRSKFLSEIDRKPFEEVVSEYCKTPLKDTVKCKLYVILKRLGVYYPLKSFYFKYVKERRAG